MSCLQAAGARTEAALARYWPLRAGSRLEEAIAYSLAGGGKRLRPALLLAAAEAAGDGEAPGVTAAAVAVELVHTYSLVHDDLPSMDDDDFRRGRPAVHKAFGEGLAVLAGDALQAAAFQVLCDGGLAEGAAADRLVRGAGLLAGAMGLAGMAGGQALDIAGTVSEETRRLKTGALFGAACGLGGLLAGADQAAVAALRGFGECFGVVYQLADDVSDGEAAAGPAALDEAAVAALRRLPAPGRLLELATYILGLSRTR